MPGCRKLLAHASWNISSRVGARRCSPASPTAGSEADEHLGVRAVAELVDRLLLQRRQLDVHLDFAQDRERNRQNDDVGLLVDGVALGLERQREARAAAPDRLEAVERADLRLDALGQLVDDALVAAAHLVALVALAKQLEGLLVLEIAGSDQEDEVQRGLFAGVQAVLGDVGDVDAARASSRWRRCRRGTAAIDIRSIFVPPPSVL